MTTTPRTVLGLFAHPDDETFGPGATLALLAARGHRVHLVCATRGEAGTIGESASMGRTALAALRTRELEGACRELGILPPRILSLPDYGLARLDEETLLRPFVGAIREYRPDILISFHADGISGHADHRTVSARVGTAFERAADAGRWPDLGPPHAAGRYWVYGISESRARRVTGRTIHAVPDEQVDAELDVADFIEAKRRAVAAHASQKPFIDWLEEHVGGLDDYWRTEAFLLAASRAPLPAGGPRPVHDLFAGM
jgi:N-acetylglucosamine malate deacetylase 2